MTAAHINNKSHVENVSQVDNMSQIDKEWQRFTPSERITRFAIYLCLVSAIVWSWQTVEVIPEFLYDAPAQFADMFERMMPLDYAFYPESIHEAMIETLNIATLGTLFTLIFAIPLALLNAPNITPNKTLNWIAQVFLVSSRSVNSLVWALLFIALFGPGLLAGIMAIAIRSIGFVGKLLAEALAEVNVGPVEALRATGASWMSILLKGYWPQVMPAFYSIVLFRWDINVRESAVLGLVGAGGIGVILNDAQNLFEWQKVAMVLVSIFTVVIVAEAVVIHIRNKLI
ncbi:Phosphonate ABC transporter, permease protein [Moritella viscosa]|uniref:Phosphonate ABC transporter, permease protein n=1 Tax=Moritella viscosa TaxID=80854 RepID=A0A090I8X8_9GAMM|nr:phosphonate ABC transporter, permease protein PhnE [Moritella viscosa]CED58335.1 putative phosphonate ABC transporter, permease protein [Moritella viscosa]SGY81380.1 Phosphonate ABC transporter, permease protein [Moritella viscosa]SHN95837.1 Phosphonate ABC transporter, permease protein [Moritella viscosa]SHN95838.1 Phosphonate ABC transporter, permease protein [Moritella viscosa]SHN95858.1 Phosphonate ABC transporter, permease protein [Moritella viscosa]